MDRLLTSLIRKIQTKIILDPIFNLFVMVHCWQGCKEIHITHLKEQNTKYINYVTDILKNLIVVNLLQYIPVSNYGTAHLEFKHVITSIKSQ